jgi:hypothetical protein
MPILGTFAIIAALAGFALFFSTMDSAYGGGVAIIIALSALLILIATGHVRLGVAYRAAKSTQRASSSPEAPLDPAARLWTLAAIFGLLIIGVVTLRFMYWL